MIGKLSSQQGEDGKGGEEGEQAALRCNGRRNPPQQVTENPAGNHQQEQAFDQPQKPPQQFVEQVKPRQLGHQIQSVAENEPEDQKPAKNSRDLAKSPAAAAASSARVACFQSSVVWVS